MNLFLYYIGGKERVELEEPYLSILLAGTHDQVSNIFSNTANGLFNRFVFYNLQQDGKFFLMFLTRRIIALLIRLAIYCQIKFGILISICFNKVIILFLSCIGSATEHL